MAIPLITTDGAMLAIKKGTGNFIELEGIQSHTEGGGDRNTTSVSTWSGTSIRVDPAEVAPVTITALPVPWMEGWQIWDEAARDNTKVTFRARTKETIIFESGSAVGHAEATIAGATGIVTFTNGDDIPYPSIAPGMAIIIGTNAYIIKSISDANVITVEDSYTAATGLAVYESGDTEPSTIASASAPAAQEFKIALPGAQAVYIADPGKPPLDLPATGSDGSTTCTVVPTAHLRWTPYFASV